MNTTTVTAQVEVTFKEGKKTIEMVMKSPQEIEECQECKIVVLTFKNGETYTGYFNGMDDENIVLGSLTSPASIGIKQRNLENYFEQVVSDK